MKKYYLYLVMLLISLMGTDLTDFTLSIWILNQPNTPIYSYTLIWFFEAAPAVLLSIFIGSFIDRWNKKKMIIYGQLATGVGSTVLLILYWKELLVPWHIMLISGIGSISSMFVFQSFFVATKALVDTKNLVKAQALLAMSYGLIQVGVPVLAPVFYKLIGLGNIFLIDVISFLISILGFTLFGFIVVKQTKDPLNIRNDLRLVKKFILDSVGFLYLLPFAFLSQFLLGLITVLFTPFILDFSDEYSLGAIFACLGIGGILGSIILSTNKSNKFTKPAYNVIIIHVIIGILIMGFAFSTNLYFIGATCMLISMLLSIKNPLYDSIILTTIPEDLLGRFSGVIGLFVEIGGPLAFLFSGFLVDILSEVFKDSIYINFYPGTVVTLSIITLYVIVGLLIVVVSFLFSHIKGIKLLDQLYVKELNKSIRTNA